MTARLIDGKRIAQETRAQAGRAAAELLRRTGVVPGLATVLVGDDPASAVYVGSKERACRDLGLASFGFRLGGHAPQAELEALIDDLNARDDVHGILVQMPLPPHLDSNRIIDRIAPGKDVDGFNLHNVGLLASRGRQPGFVPCTPAGVMVLLEHTGLTLAGMDAVVLGRSNIVGQPMAQLLQRADATVTICHSRSRHVAAHLGRADLVVAALGRPEYVRGEMLKAGAVVVDVGINRVPDPAAPRGYRLVGDVHLESAREVASWITPVPGGVGPMTIAMLMRQTVHAAELQPAFDGARPGRDKA